MKHAQVSLESKIFLQLIQEKRFENLCVIFVEVTSGTLALNALLAMKTVTFAEN